MVLYQRPWLIGEWKAASLSDHCYEFNDVLGSDREMIRTTDYLIMCSNYSLIVKGPIW